MEKYIINEGCGIFVQLGAGAGDLDPRTFYQDGFSKFIKSLPKQSLEIIIKSIIWSTSNDNAHN